MDTKLIAAIGALLIMLAMLIRYKKNIVPPMAIALILSAVWTALYRYEYIGENIFLFHRINVYPLVLWTCGLTSLYILQTYVVKTKNVILLTGLYLVLLYVLEAIGYHLLDIRLASNYPSLWNSGIIHGSILLKVFYIVVGPTYLILLQSRYIKR